GAAASRFLVGAGFGLFFPGGLVYVRSLIPGPNPVFMLGIYTTMITLPNFFGPGIAEIIYRTSCVRPLLLAFTLPHILSPLLMRFLPHSTKPIRSSKLLGYVAILRTKSILVPNSAITIVGLLWGFMLSFMALYLETVNVLATVFLSGATLSMLV